MRTDAGQRRGRGKGVIGRGRRKAGEAARWGRGLLPVGRGRTPPATATPFLPLEEQAQGSCQGRPDSRRARRGRDRGVTASQDADAARPMRRVTARRSCAAGRGHHRARTRRCGRLLRQGRPRAASSPSQSQPSPGRTS